MGTEIDSSWENQRLIEENADLRRERNEFEQRLQELRKAHERLTEHCHDMAAQFETDQGIIKADGKEIHYLRQRVRELEHDFAVANDVRHELQAIWGNAAVRIAELEAELAALQKRIDDAPVVAWVIGRRAECDMKGWIPAMAWTEGEFTTPLISKEDLK